MVYEEDYIEQKLVDVIILPSHLIEVLFACSLADDMDRKFARVYQYPLAPVRAPFWSKWNGGFHLQQLWQIEWVSE